MSRGWAENEWRLCDCRRERLVALGVLTAARIGKRRTIANLDSPFLCVRYAGTGTPLPRPRK